jgi:hypothetical protein
MTKWLALMATLPLAAAVPAYAQMKDFSAADVASVARTRTIDLRLTENIGAQRPAPLMRGMLLHHDFAANATIGVGLANIYARKSGSDLRFGDRPSRSRKPAVTFVLKF